MMRRAQPWLGTLVDISADGPVDAITAAFAEVALVHGLMSFHDPASDVSRFNRAEAGSLLAVHPHTWHVLTLAQQLRAASGGIFNIACAPRLVAWGCLPRDPTQATPAYQPELDVLRCEPKYFVRKCAPGWIDLGGIAKGYAVDLAIGALARHGVQNACVNAGGDLRTLGERNWPVAVRDPAAPGRAGMTLSLCNEALATSASYFSARTFDNRTDESVDSGEISALVDGRDGAPQIRTRSVSVRAPLCVAADALTKIVLASGDPLHAALAGWQASAFII